MDMPTSGLSISHKARPARESKENKKRSEFKNINIQLVKNSCPWPGFFRPDIFSLNHYKNPIKQHIPAIKKSKYSNQGFHCAQLYFFFCSTLFSSFVVF